MSDGWREPYRLTTWREFVARGRLASMPVEQPEPEPVSMLAKDKDGKVRDIRRGLPFLEPLTREDLVTDWRDAW